MRDRIIDFVFPPQCGGCGRKGDGVCESCLPPGVTIARRLRGLRVRALAPYTVSVRRAIHALKDGRRDVAAALGERLAHHVAAGTILVPVPTTRARRRVRGFDGVVTVVSHAAALADATVLEALQCLGTGHQRGKSREERLASVGRFRCSEIVAGCEVVLVDDVCTTGTTFEDCAAALRSAGARVEEALAIALVG